MIVPARVTKEVADDFIDRLHRHHDHDQGARFYVGAWDCERDKLCGVGVVGRPRAQALTPYKESIVEVTRCCVDGTKDACSFVYARARDVAQDLGFYAIITYTLASESGASLRALGWWPERLKPRTGEGWGNRAGRDDDHVTADWRWLCLLCDEPRIPEQPRVALAAQLALAVTP